jgi:DNA-binding transcriptional MocR family regulator
MMQSTALLTSHFPGTRRSQLTGGFFADLSLSRVPGDKEQSFLKSANACDVHVAAAWDAVAPDRMEKKRKQGLFIRLTFPAHDPEDITWGISKLKELEQDY